VPAPAATTKKKGGISALQALREEKKRLEEEAKRLQEEERIEEEERRAEEEAQRKELEKQRKKEKEKVRCSVKPLSLFIDQTRFTGQARIGQEGGSFFDQEGKGKGDDGQHPKGGPTSVWCPGRRPATVIR
jgi:hypothetical protein